MEKMNAILDAFYSFISTFDGDKLLYHSRIKHHFILNEEIYNGPYKDSVNFKNDLRSAIGHVENERQNYIG